MRVLSVANLTKRNDSLRVEPLSLHQQHIDTLAKWHYNEWAKFYPESTIDDFMNDLVESLQESAVPAKNTIAVQKSLSC